MPEFIVTITQGIVTALISGIFLWGIKRFTQLSDRREHQRDECEQFRRGFYHARNFAADLLSEIKVVEDCRLRGDAGYTVLLSRLAAWRMPDLLDDSNATDSQSMEGNAP